MLVLTRKPGERIVIGSDRTVVVTIVDVRSGKVRVGVDAPRDVLVLRDELNGQTPPDRLLPE